MLLRRTRHVHPLLLYRIHFSTSTTASGNSGAGLPSDPSIAKIISTVFLLSPPASAATRLEIVRYLISPSTASDVIHHRIRDPKLVLSFFDLTRTEFRITHSVPVYRFVVRILCQRGFRDDAVKVFDEMRGDGHLPDGFVLGVLVSAYARAGDLDIAMGFLGRSGEWGCKIDTYFYNDVINRLMERSRHEDAIQFFCDQLISLVFVPDTWSFNIVIKGLCRLGKVDRALEFFSDMGRFRCSPDRVTYNTLVDGFCRASQVDRGRDLLGRIRMNGNGLDSPSVVTYTSLISGYCKIGRMYEAIDVFNEMVSLGVMPNKFTYNVLIDGYGKAGDTASATSMYERMLLSGCSPDVVTLTSLVDVYCRNGHLDDALNVWNEMKKMNLWPNVYTFTIVIHAFCKQNRSNEARVLLLELGGRKDLVARPFMYNPVIDRFCKVGNVDEANLILAEMEDIGCFPDKVTYTILIIGHCMKGRMLDATRLFNKMVMNGCNPDSITISSLVSCLLKAGMPKEAERITSDFSVKESGGRTLSSTREKPIYA